MTMISKLFAGLPAVALEVALALVPLFLLVPLVSLLYRPPARLTRDIWRGLLLTFIGITLLLHGVHVGFLSAGQSVGEVLGALPAKWLAIPIGALLGFVAALAEPAVHVLCAQVESASSGSIRKRVLLYTVSGSVSLLVALGMARIVYGIPFAWLIFAGYGIVLLILQFSDPVFSAIAFDAGGVATGPMMSTFVLSVGIGIAAATAGRDPIQDGFGLVALVALAPILAIMLLGRIYQSQRKGEQRDQRKE